MSEQTILPPMDLAAERAVLGAVLLDSKEALPKIRRLLASSHFWLEKHRIIYQAMLSCWDHRNGCIDYVLLCDELERSGKLLLAGDRPYITELVLACPTCLYGVQYAQTVKDLAIRREQIRRGGQMAARAFNR